MNTIVSFSTRFLYSFVAVFFFAFTIQSSIAGGAYNHTFATFQEYVNYNRTVEGANSSLEDRVWHSLRNLPKNDPALKDKILAIKDAAGNNLAHAILKGDTLFIEPYTLFEVCGIDVFKAKNHQGLTPLQANLGKMSKLFDSRSRGGGVHVVKLQDGLKPLVREMLPELMDLYIHLQSTLASVRSPDEIKRDLKNTALALGVSVRLSDISSLRSIYLEHIDHPEFYREMATSPEGRKILRDYRVHGQTTLYNYFSEYDLIASELLPIYYEVGVAVPSPRDVDIKTGADIRDPSEEFFQEYENKQGQNMAFLAARNFAAAGLLKKMNDRGVNVKAMLRQKDKSGQDALARIRDIINCANALIDIDPTFLTTPCFKDGTTPLMVLALFESERFFYQSIAQYSDIKANAQYSDIKAKLSERGIKIDQKDVAGNTADNIARAKTQYLQRNGSLDSHFIPRFLYTVLSKQPLESNLWQTIIDHPYSQMLVKIYTGAFIEDSLSVIFNMTHSPIRSAFLQQNPSDFASQAKTANELWSAFFSAYDDLERIDTDFVNEAKLALPIRVLKTADYFRPSLEINEEPDPTIIQAMQTLQSNILATGGTFGMNFKRTANEQEARIIIERLTRLGISISGPKKQKFRAAFGIDSLNETLDGLNETQKAETISRFIKDHNSTFTGHITKENAEQNLYDYIAKPFVVEAANEIMQRLFRVDSTLTEEQRFKLEDHQTNCAVIALMPVFEGRFDEIDQVLASRPLMKYKGAKQRYDDVMKIASSV